MPQRYQSPIPLGQVGPIKWRVEDLKNNKAQREGLWKVVEQYTGHPVLMDWAAELIRTRDVPERDNRALARAIQQYAQQHIKFFRENPERFVSPMTTIRWGIGDCDDKTILIAAFLRSFRVPVRAKFLRFRMPNKDGSTRKVAHVYPEVQLDGRWEALESVHHWEIGDSPETRTRAKTKQLIVETIGPT